MIVADAGPIIAFARIGRLDLLRGVVGEVVVPEAVYEEIVAKGANRPGADEVAHSNWIRRRPVTERAVLAGLPAFLHAGEREAIALAYELGTQILIDEARGRRSAAAHGIEVMGTLGILAEAKRLGYIPSAGPLLAELLDTGYWIDEDLIAAFLREVGETDSK